MHTRPPTDGVIWTAISGLAAVGWLLIRAGKKLSRIPFL